jgi:hypothetical protein
MPIRKEERHHYEGPAWKEAREVVLARARDCCERCRKPNGARVVVTSEGRSLRAGRWRPWDGRSGLWTDDWTGPDGQPCPPPSVGSRLRVTRVVLTVAHLNHQAGDNRPENLQALCQRCHLMHDLQQHVQNGARTRWAKKKNLELGLTPCCERDTDSDGNCDRHPRGRP